MEATCLVVESVEMIALGFGETVSSVQSSCDESDIRDGFWKSNRWARSNRSCRECGRNTPEDAGQKVVSKICVVQVSKPFLRKCERALLELGNQSFCFVLIIQYCRQLLTWKVLCSECFEELDRHVEI